MLGPRQSVNRLTLSALAVISSKRSDGLVERQVLVQVLAHLERRLDVQGQPVTTPRPPSATTAPFERVRSRSRSNVTIRRPP